MGGDNVEGKVNYVYDALGNITKVTAGDKTVIMKNAPEYNLITASDDMTVVRAKQAAQKELCAKKLG